MSGCGTGEEVSTTTVTEPATPTDGSETTPNPDDSAETSPPACEDFLETGSDTGTCTAGTETRRVVASDRPLKLADTDITLDAVSVEDDLTDPVLDMPVRPDGKFVVMELTVSNETDRAQAFNADEKQARLTLDGAIYTPQDYEVQAGTVGGGGSSTQLLIQQDIQPGGEATGVVVFDVPDDRVDLLERSGAALEVRSFTGGDTGLIRLPSR